MFSNTPSIRVGWNLPLIAHRQLRVEPRGRYRLLRPIRQLLCQPNYLIPTIHTLRASPIRFVDGGAPAVTRSGLHAFAFPRFDADQLLVLLPNRGGKKYFRARSPLAPSTYALSLTLKFHCQGDTWEVILAEFNRFTREQVFEWNVVLVSICDGLWAGNYYCVAAYGITDDLPLRHEACWRTQQLSVGIRCLVFTTGTDTCDAIMLISSTFAEDEFKA